MTEILCTHKWTGFFPESIIEGKVVERAFKVCRLRCETPWYEGEPEPEVVIGRIR